MITVGLSQHEINLITKVLDEHKVEYHVDAAGGANSAQDHARKYFSRPCLHLRFGA